MLKPKMAMPGPYIVDVEKGKKYQWCSCGLSKTQPFCDKSHEKENSIFKPFTFVATKDETVQLCGCKRTKTPPFCHGTHKEWEFQDETD